MRALDGGLVGAVSLLALMGSAGAPVAAAEIDVVASIKPVHSLVAGVMEGIGKPALLVKGTGSEHSYSLRPSEARALEQAEVVFWVGETMETFLLKPLHALAGNAKVIELWPVPGLTLLATREGLQTMGTARPTCTSGSVPAMPRCSRQRSRQPSATQTQEMLRSTGPTRSVCASGWTSSTVLFMTDSRPLPIVRTSCSTMPINTSSTGTG
jgi:hypothetical protein